MQFQKLAQVSHTKYYALVLIKLWIQIFPEIPRLHHVKELRKAMNQEIEVLSLPQPYVGRYMAVRSTVERTLAETVSTTKLHFQNTHSYLCLSAGETGSTTTTNCNHEAFWRWCSYCSISYNGLPHLLLPWPF